MNRLRGHKGDVYAVTIFDKYIISAGHDKYIRVYDSSTCKLINEITAHDHIIHAIEVYHDSTAQSNPIIISGSWDTTIKFFDLYTLKNISVHRYHSSRVRCIAISSRLSEHASVASNTNGAVLLSGDDDGNVKGLHIATEMILFQVCGHGRFVLSLDVMPSSSPADCIFASGSSDCCLAVWSLYTGDQIRSIKLSKSITCIAFVPTSISITRSRAGNRATVRLLVCGCSDGSIHAFDVDSGDDEYKLMGGHTAPISGLSFLNQTSPAGEGKEGAPSPLLVSISSDGILCLWCLDTGRQESTFYFNGEGLAPFNGSVGEGFVQKSLHAIKVQDNGHMCNSSDGSDGSSNLQKRLTIGLCGADSYLAIVKDDVNFRTVLSSGEGSFLSSSRKAGNRDGGGNKDGAVNSGSNITSRMTSSKVPSAMSRNSSDGSIMASSAISSSDKDLSRKLLLKTANLVRVNTANRGRRVVSVEGEDELSAINNKISSELVSSSNAGGDLATTDAGRASSLLSTQSNGSSGFSTKSSQGFVKNPNRSASVSTGVRGMAGSSSLPFLKLDEAVVDIASDIDNNSHRQSDVRNSIDSHPHSEAERISAAFARNALEAGYKSGLYSSKSGRLRARSRRGRGRLLIENKNGPLPANVLLAPETDTSFDYGVAVKLIRRTLQTINATGRLPVVKTFKTNGQNQSSNLSSSEGLHVGAQGGRKITKSEL